MRYLVLLVLLGLPIGVAAQQERLVRLYAPEALVETGLMKHILPRFSLKTQVKVALAETPAAADMVLGAQGRAIFEGAGQAWHMQIVAQDHKPTARLADWLTSDVGRRTIFGFAPDGVALFAPPAAKAVVAVEVEMDGDAQLGHKVSRVKCARCHAVDEASRMGTIGSTPSFFILRAFEDWDARFSGFYLLKPHPAFTQVEDVTDPFPEDRPSPIVPIEVTLDELEAILAYVQALAPADLGAPLQTE
ncbi:hypothetical protein AIOL_001485 [Candidatus Rhodobacter oscarellae]|uniref:Cytochrome c domain-containing protein n=1 Tax=Candidatus Rhodobacter oscarellae TaxID=1675527 RepID=A0A0J9E0S1_9RHOB|nr:hypothetical protein [Candidatus Rhodobacter lobularis]KMW56531.1 hypothetical protein AIOL_001485 [Candidatus Rhodobacter lobularis]